MASRNTGPVILILSEGLAVMRLRIIGTLVLASVTWGCCFAGGHASAKAVAADRTNLAKARTVATANRKANGDSAAQRAAALKSLSLARAIKAEKMAARKAGN